MDEHKEMIGQGHSYRKRERRNKDRRSNASTYCNESEWNGR